MKQSQINALSVLGIEINDKTPLVEIVSAAEKLGYAVKNDGFEFSLVKTVSVKPVEPANEPEEAPNHFNAPFVDFDGVEAFDAAVMRYQQLDPNSYAARQFKREYIDNPHGMAEWVNQHHTSVI